MAEANDGGSDPETLVRQFYLARQKRDPEDLRPLIADDVVWQEPEVGDHMGTLTGIDAVIDMMTRARLTTGGSFELRPGEMIATGTSCAAIIQWRAEKNGRTIEGRELAIYRFRDGVIKEARFLPDDLADDHAFWA